MQWQVHGEDVFPRATKVEPFGGDCSRVSDAPAILALIQGRYQVSPRRLIDPGPDVQQQRWLWEAAAAAPDHGCLTPWRFVVIAPEQRTWLGEVFARALIERDPGATLDQIQTAREKAQRAPFLALAIADLRAHVPDIPAQERLISLGCALQNILLCAHAMGFGAGLSSGRAMQSAALRSAFGLAPGEDAVCFVSVGTEVKHKPPRVRPDPATFVSNVVTVI